MRKRLVGVAVVATAVLALGVAIELDAAAPPPRLMRAYTAILTSGQVVPPVTNIFGGTGFLTVDEPTKTLTYSFPGPEGNTRTAVRFHGPARPGEEADVLFDVPPTNFGQPIQGVVQLTRAQVGYFRRGLVYVEVETSVNPTGEIRGQVVPTGVYRSPSR